MKKTGKHIVFSTLAFLCLFAVKAQEIQFYANVDKNPVKVGDVFTYQITLENARAEITPPSFSDFTEVSGAMQSSNFRIVNGRQTSSITKSYRIRAHREGEFTIREASTYINGVAHHTEPITIKVGKGTSGQTTSSQSQGTYAQQSTNDENVILQIQINKHKVSLGDQITATYVVLTRYRNFDLENYEFPSTPGFWVEEQRQDQLKWEPDYEFVNGIPYRKIIFKKQILFPQRAGKLEIKNFEITARINRSFLSAGEKLTAKSNTPVIEVLPLPDPAPDSFQGAVGKFNFEVNADRTEVNANDAINLNITISGSGNLKLIHEPHIDFPQDFETYDPDTKDRINVTGTGMSGSRSFHYLIIPRYAGNYEIPAIEFTFFDPQQKEYVTMKRGPFPIEVIGSSSVSSSMHTERAQSKITQSGEDIRFIKTQTSSLKPKGNQFFATTSYYLSMGMPFLGFILFLFLKKRKASQLDDVEGTRRKKANKMARRKLKLAAIALKEDDSKTFYAEIFKALYGYMSDNLGISRSLLSKPVITENLKERNVDDELIDELIKNIETCEMARFAWPGNHCEKEFYNQTVKLISKLESALK